VPPLVKEGSALHKSREHQNQGALSMKSQTGFYTFSDFPTKKAPPDLPKRQSRSESAYMQVVIFVTIVD
jgi:hypothetical protein